MRLIFLGKPGSGKGTECNIICEKLDIPHISTGDMFRKEIKDNSDLGKLANEYISVGKLVPDEVTIKLVKKRLMEKDCQKGYVFDGFPRTIIQAKMLYEIAKIDAVINLEVDDKSVLERLTSRRICTKCGEIFNISSQKTEKCLKCGGELYQRNDDKEETIKNRLVQYNQMTKPLIDYYTEKEILKNIKQGSVKEVTDTILSIVKELEAKK